jgi:two-component system LytT family sensor kinase
MNHPVFQNLRSIVFYFGLWILIAGIHFSVLFFQYSFPAGISLSDSLLYNALFCMLGLPVWYIVRYNLPDKKALGTMLLNQVTMLVLVLVIWMGAGYSLLVLINAENSRYIRFLSDTIPYRLISGLFFYLMTVFGYYLLIYNRNLQEKIVAEARLNELLKEAELSALRSQINPHFLFNSLNSISALTMTDPENAREMIIKLADFLRYSVSSGNTVFTGLGNEISNIRRYLDIEQTRFGDKLKYEFDIPPQCLDNQVPAMILQPLFENAIKHGVYESIGEVMIHTVCHPRDGYLDLVITNDFDPEAPPRKGTGTGLKNIRSRLRLLYRSDDLLKTSIDGHRFTVNISIPCTTKNPQPWDTKH